MNIANNDFENNMKKIYAISQNFLLQGQIYNSLSKSYYCVMENTTVNAVNVVKTTLWQSNLSNRLKQLITYVNTLRFLKLKQNTIYIAVTILLLLYFLSTIKIKFHKCTQKRMMHESGNDSCSLM